MGSLVRWLGWLHVARLDLQITLLQYVLSPWLWGTDMMLHSEYWSHTVLTLRVWVVECRIMVRSPIVRTCFGLADSLAADLGVQQWPGLVGWQ